MSFFTALYLSFKNLLHKKGRTFLTSFAGSIGIIGVALVLAISNGFTNYINSMQSDTLSGYPVTVSTATIDYSSFTSFESGGSSSNVADSDDYAYIYDSGLQQYIKYGHYNYISPNFVEKVKQLESEDSEKGANKELNLVQYNYFTPIKILVKNDDGSISLTANKNSLSILSGSAGSSFYEALSSEDFMMEQYETIYQIDDYDPDNIYNLTLVVSKGNKITSGLLKSLGITPEQNIDGSYKNISFEEICNREFKLVYNDEYYSYDAENDEFSVLDTTDQTALNDLFDGSQVKTLKIARVIRQKEDSDTSLLSSGVMYTSALAKEYRENCAESEIAQKQAERKEAESTAGSYSFYAPFVIDISEFSGMGMLPADGFKNTVEINYFLNNYFKLNIASNEAYELAMQQIGCSSIPQSISFYTKNFDAKKSVTNLIDDYNKTVDEAHQIIYTDQADFLTKTLGAMINIVSYVLIAFASISLVVSSIMIGIITYVSVIERTKEIGVLRSLGARKKDISRVFNAETLIIGFMAGFIGVVISYALCPIISLIVHNLASGISNIATLNPLHALILIVISMALTLISGSIPSKIASKKDPVECLRSE
jgi:putative ABC transport system permease protein